MSESITANGRTGRHRDLVLLPAIEGDERPPELADFERATDPYSNMLPTTSSVNAGRAIAGGIEIGARGRPVVLAVSLVLVLVLPLILSVVSQLAR